MIQVSNNPSGTPAAHTTLQNGTLAFTGAGPGVWIMALGGLFLLNLGFLVMTLYYRPRELLVVAAEGSAGYSAAKRPKGHTHPSWSDTSWGGSPTFRHPSAPDASRDCCIEPVGAKGPLTPTPVGAPTGAGARDSAPEPSRRDTSNLLGPRVGACLRTPERCQTPRGLTPSIAAL